MRGLPPRPVLTPTTTPFVSLACPAKSEMRAGGSLAVDHQQAPSAGIMAYGFCVRFVKKPPHPAASKEPHCPQRNSAQNF
jgi:hypothetical protein